MQNTQNSLQKLFLSYQNNNKIIYMLAFSHFIDLYWQNDEKEFNSSINQENPFLNNKLKFIQTKKDIFNILNLDDIKLIIKDLYFKRSLFIHFVNFEEQTNLTSTIEIKKVFYKIFKFKLDKNDFIKRDVKNFIDKYINFLSSIIFIYSSEQNIFFQDLDPYEEKLMAILSINLENRYGEINFEPVNWYNQYFNNKLNEAKLSGKRYESFLSNYVNILNKIYENNENYYFNNYFIHKKVKFINGKKYIVNKRHYNNSIVLMFNKEKKPKSINSKFALIDYKIFLIVEFIKVSNNQSNEFRDEILKKIIQVTIEKLKNKSKTKNQFSTVYEYKNILFDNKNFRELKLTHQFLEKWLMETKLKNKSEYSKFAKNMFICTLIYNKLHLNITFSKFLNKYKNLNFNEFLLYFFVVDQQKEKLEFNQIWNNFIEDSNNNFLNNKFISTKIIRKISISKYKNIYIAGTTKEFFKYYELIINKKHLLRIVKNNRIKNNCEYSIKYIWDEIEKVILIKLFNPKDNLEIINKYEEIKETSKIPLSVLTHNYRNYIAHLGKGNETLFNSYKDYVQKKWKTKEYINKNYEK